MALPQDVFASDFFSAVLSRWIGLQGSLDLVASREFLPLRRLHAEGGVG